MKKLQIVFLAALLLFTFTGCKAENKTDTPPEIINEAEITTASDIPTEVSTESADTPSVELSTQPALLTYEEIISIYTDAAKLYLGWVNYCFSPNLDYDNILIENATQYAPIYDSEFASFDEMEAALQKTFAEEVYRDYIDRYYTMIDGVFCGMIELGQGGDAPVSNLYLTVDSITADACTFTVSESEYDQYATQYTMLLVDGNWQFQNFNSAAFDLYYSSVEWIY